MTAEARLLQQARDRAARFEVSPGKEQPWDARRFGKGGTRPFVVRGSGRTGAEGKERAMKKGIAGAGVPAGAGGAAAGAAGGRIGGDVDGDLDERQQHSLGGRRHKRLGHSCGGTIFVLIYQRSS